MDEHLPIDYMATCDVQLDPCNPWSGLTRLSMPKHMPDLPEGMAIVGQYVLEVMGIAKPNPIDMSVISEVPLYYRMAPIPSDYRICSVYTSHCVVETYMSKIIHVCRYVYESPSHLAHAQVVDCHGIIYTRDEEGKPGIWATARALYALHHRINWVRGRYLSWSYVYYVCHLKAMGGFEIGLPGFDERQLDRCAIHDVFQDILKYGGIPCQAGSCKHHTKTIADRMYSHIPFGRLQHIQCLIHQLAGHGPAECVSHMDVMRKMFPGTMYNGAPHWREWGTLLILGHLYGLTDPSIHQPLSLVPSSDTDIWISSEHIPTHREFDMNAIYSASLIMK